VSAAPATAPRRSDALPLLLLAAVSLCWGLNWPVMKIALTSIPVLPFRALSVLVAGPALLAFAALRGDSLAVPRQQRGTLLAAALFNVTLWNLLSATGVSLMAAGRASIIAYTMPAWASLFGAIILGERLDRRRLLALLLGVLGIAALILPELRAMAAAPLGALAMVGAAMAWAAGTVTIKRVRWTASVAVLTGWRLVSGGLPILLAAIAWGQFPGLGDASTTALAALAYAILLGSMFGQWAWFVVLSALPVAVASVGSLAIPVVGTLASSVLLHEPLGAAELAALALVVSALALLLLPGARRP